MKELGESLIPSRAPKDKADQFGEIEANSMIAFSYTVRIYRNHDDMRKKRSDLELLATLEKVSPGSTLYFYKCRDPKMGYVLVARRLHKTEREKNRKKYPLPPMHDDQLPASEAHSKPPSSRNDDEEEDDEEEDFFIE